MNSDKSIKEIVGDIDFTRNPNANRLARWSWFITPMVELEENKGHKWGPSVQTNVNLNDSNEEDPNFDDENQSSRRITEEIPPKPIWKREKSEFKERSALSSLIKEYKD